MDFLKAQAQKIREQLAGLTPSQRMLAGALVVIMMMTLLWWSRYAGTSEMEDVLGQDFAAEQVAGVTGRIASRGIPYKVVGNRVQVAADRKLEVLALLTYEQLLPRDTTSGFDDIVTKMDSPWNTTGKQDVMFNRAKEATIAQIMREWPGIRDAMVVINNAQRRAFGEASVQPTSTVSLRMKQSGDKPPKRLIAAAADTVAGAVSGMLRSKVNVIVDGASYNVQDHDADSGTSDSWMDMVKEHERYFSQKIQDHLRRIDGVMVSVSVDPKMQASQIEKETYDKAKSFSQPLETIEKSEENSTSSKPPSEPGVVPNTTSANQGANIGGGGGGGGGEGTTSTVTENKVKNQNFSSVIREWIKSPAGASAVVGASVSIPRSHFVRIFKGSNASAKDPDDATLGPLIDAELRRIKNSVLGCVSQTPEEKVLVDWFYDYVPAGDVAAQPAVAASVPLALTAHIKEIALGLLAVVSLFMVSMMVRKSTPAPIVMPKIERPAPPVMNVGGQEDVAGEAGEGVQSMDGMEVDDDSIRTQQMIGQVSTMVKEDPDAAANLVKRWLSRA